MKRPPPTIDDLQGLWHRTLYRRRWRAIERDTEVCWLQGPRLFADLRQPPERPDFAGVRCLRQLQWPHVQWMARQHGFAGHLTIADGVAEWHRTIDFQPGNGGADRARVRLRGAVLREDGIGDRYHETWHRDAASTAPRWGLRLVDDGAGHDVVLVRVGAEFVLARGRPARLRAYIDLAGLCRSMSKLEDQQNLLDCEISRGRIAPEDGLWRIDRSTLPFKEGTFFRASVDPDDASHLRVADIGDEGQPIVRTWRIVEADAESHRDSLSVWINAAD